MRVCLSSLRAVLASIGWAVLVAASASAMAQTAPVPPSSQTVAMAATYGNSPELVVARQAVAKAFYDTAEGMAGRWAGDSQGIDFTKPVTVVEIAADAPMFQFVNTGYATLKPGNFFSPSKVVPTCLGISGASRALYTVALPAGKGLQSTASPIVDTWSVPGASVQTEGGCTQVVVDYNMRNGTKLVAPVQ